ncbi:MAG: type III secretion inner membrane ring lipoprotein SctJ [Pseudomonadota bacterium]
MLHYAKRLRVLFAVLLLTTFLAGCDVIAHSNLSENAVNEMLALLRNNGVAAQKVEANDELWTLMVPDADLARSLDILKVHGLPRLHYSGLGAVFEKAGMVSTPTEERARMLYALSEELSSTISHIDGVLTARVHIVLPQLNTLGKSITTPKASVFIRHRDDLDMQANVSKVKSLIQNSVPNLEYADISVSLFPSSTDIAESTPQEIVTIDKNSTALGALVATLIALCVFFVQRKYYLRKNAEQDTHNTTSE